MVDAVFPAQPTAGGTNIDQEQVTQGGGATALRQRVRLGGALGTALADIVSSVGTALGHLLVGTQNERVDGTITQASTLGAASAAGLTGADGNPGAIVLLAPKMNHESWTVQVTGAWAGTIVTEVTTAIDPTSAGAYWIPVNSRQSAGGRLANNFTVSGLFRGAYGGLTGIRTRATVLTSGTPAVSILTGLGGAIFSNSDLVVQSEAQYFASSAGLNSGWTVASQDIPLATSGTEYPLMWLFNNDAVGGRVLYLSRLVIAANNTSRVRRYRTGPGGTQMTRTSGGTALTINNRANQNAAATAAVAYAGTGLVIANIPAYYEKSTYTPSTGGQVETDEGGSILIPPQTGIYWTAVCGSANELAMIEAVFWDGSSLT